MLKIIWFSVHCKWDIVLVRNASVGFGVWGDSRDTLDASGITMNLIMPRVSNMIVVVVVVIVIVLNS